MSDDKIDVIRRAVKQARWEIAHKSEFISSTATLSAPTISSNTSTVPGQCIGVSPMQRSINKMDMDKHALVTDTDDSNSVTSVFCNGYDALDVASTAIEEPPRTTIGTANGSLNNSGGDEVINKTTRSVPALLSNHLSFAVVKSKDNLHHRQHVSVSNSASWAELTHSIAKCLKLYSPTSVLEMELVNCNGDILSSNIACAVKFFNVIASYEEGMMFRVAIDDATEVELAKANAVEEFHSRGLCLTIRNAESGEIKPIYSRRGCTWQELTSAIAEEFTDVSPQWIMHIVLEDADEDEISPPLNTAEIFWQFCRSASAYNGDVFVFTLDQQRRDSDVSLASCVRVCAQVQCAENLRPKSSKEYVMIPRECSWNDIRRHVALVFPGSIKHEECISHMVMVNTYGDSISTSINEDLTFWKFMSTYEHDVDMTLCIFLEWQTTRVCECEYSHDTCRASVAHFKACIANSLIAETTDIYLPINCSWEELSNELASFMGLADTSWIDYIIFLDVDGDPLSPSVNTDAKFWKLGKKLSDKEGVIISIHLKSDVCQNIRKDVIVADAFSFCVRWNADLNRTAIACATPDCSWSDICQRASHALELEVPDSAFHMVLVNKENGNIISPPIETVEMFWQFYKKMASTSAFDLYQDEAMMTGVISESAKLHNLQENCLAELTVQHSFICKVYDSTSTAYDPFQISIGLNCCWDDIIVAAVSCVGRIEVDDIDYLQLVDANGLHLSVPINNSRLFWKLGNSLGPSSGYIFEIHLTHCGSPTKSIEMAHKKPVTVINVALGKDKPDEARIPSNACWNDILDSIAGAVSSRVITSHMIGYVVLYDVEGSQLSPILDTADKFWAVVPIYNAQESMVFLITLNNNEIRCVVDTKVDAAVVEPEELIPLVLAGGVNTRVPIHISHDISWDILCEKVREVFGINRSMRVSLFLADAELDELSPAITNVEKFWKIFLNNFKASTGAVFVVHISNIQEPNGKSHTLSHYASSAAKQYEGRAFRSNDPVLVAEFFKSCESIQDIHLHVDERGVDPNALNENKSAVMHFACMSGNLEVAKALYDRGADPNRINSAGMTPFDCACIAGHIDICIWLFSLKCVDSCSNYTESGDVATPPLHLAATNGHTDIVAWLMKNAFDKEIRGRFDTTAVMEAAHNGQLASVVALVEAGADVCACDSKGVTGFLLACSEGHLSVAKYLHSKGVQANSADKNAKSAFMYACCGGQLEVAQWLVSVGANYRAIGGRYDMLNTPVHMAAQSGNVDLLRWLVEDLHLEPCSLNGKGASAIAFARAAGRPAAEAYLCKFNGNRYCLYSTVECLDLALSENNFTYAKTILERIVNSDSDNIQLPYGTSSLHYVAASGHTELAQFLIIKGTNVNVESALRRTPLHYAAFKGHIEMCKYLFSVGANLNAKDVYGYTGLTIASTNNDTELMNWFTTVAMDSPDSQPFVELEESNGSSLFGCIGQSSFTRSALIEFRDCNSTLTSTTEQQGECGTPSSDVQLSPFSTALQNACIVGDLEHVKSLVEGGAQLNGKLGPEELSPLHCAVISGNLSLVQFLFNMGAHLNAQNINGSADFDGSSSVHEAMTPLHIACDKKDESMIMFLIKNGADMYKMNKVGDTPLHILCLLGMHIVLTQIIDLPRSVVPGINLDVRSSHLLNLLHCAADAGSLPTVQLLIDHEVAVNSFDDEKKTPLHYACGKGALDVVQLLVTSGAIVDLQDTSSRTPFLYACNSGNLDMVEYLAHQGARLDCKTDKGNNALHIACKSGFLHVAKWLVSNGVDPLGQNRSGNLPAHYAQVNGYIEVVQWLEMTTKVKISVKPKDIPR